MDRPGSMGMKGGYFLKEDVRNFDNSFFGINNLEATYMDPQQRKLLEVVYECLENVGVTLDKASGSNTALQNYECDAAIVAGGNLIQSAEQHIATMKAGVLSPTSACHTFDSSADGYGRADGIGALYVKRLSDAIADGDPIRSVIRGTAVNANGRTSGISLPSADGQEMVIRKALAQARLDPDDITYIECHGTGTKVGDAIEVEALSRVFRDHSRRPDTSPLLIGAVKSNIGHSEAASGISSIIKTTLSLERGKIPPTHGLKNINPKLRIEERNIHIPVDLETWPDEPSRVRRAGINSFGYGGANSHAVLEEASFLQRHERQEGALQEVNGKHHGRCQYGGQSSVVLLLSAASRSSLDARVADFTKFDFGDIDLLDLAYTLASRRTHFPFRGFVIAPHDTESAISQLFSPENMRMAAAATVSSSKPATFGFVFTGQGSQWPGMCRELFKEFPVFRNAITEMEIVLRALTSDVAPAWSLQNAILDTDNPDLIHLPERSQPCCTAIQVALIQLLASWEIVPDITVGHSSGEIAAAFATGHISAAEAIVIAYLRGYLVANNKKQPNKGAMMAVGLSETAAKDEIAKLALNGQVCVACINSTEGVTVSGDELAIDKLLQGLEEKKVFARKLKTGGQAYHSHHMLAIGDKYEAMVDRVLPTLGPSVYMAKGPATFISSVAVGPKSSSFTGKYWRRNLESQVRFAPAIERITKDHPDICFIELGPHSSLELPIRQVLAKAGISGTDVKYAAPVKRNTNALDSVLGFAGSLWLQGFDVNWSKVNGLQSSPLNKLSSRRPYRTITDLPPYQFDYSNGTLWKECRSSIEYRQRKYPRHELLGSLMPGGNGRDFIFSNILKAGDVVWLQDHRLGETIVFPGSGYLAMAMEAIMQATDVDRATESPSFRFSNVNITNALILDTSSPSSQAEVFTSLRKSALTNAADSMTWWDFNISSFQADRSSLSHATGAIAIANDTILVSKYLSPEDSLEPTAKRTWYERFVQQGLNYGPAFQTISHFETPRMKSSHFCSAKAPLLTAYGDPTTVYPIHPITLDGLMQLAVVAAANGTPKDLRAVVPTRLVSVTIKSASPGSSADLECQMNALVKSIGFGPIEAGTELIAHNGDVLAQFGQVRLTPYTAATSSLEGSSNKDRRHPVLRVLWKPDVYGLGFVSSDAAGQLVQKFADEADSPVSDLGLLKFGAMLDLLTHKNPRARILELGNESSELTSAILDLLAWSSDFKRFTSYSTASFAEGGRPLGGLVDLETGRRQETSIEKEAFDLVLIPGAGSWVQSHMPQITDLLAPGASLLALCPDSESGLSLKTSLLCLECPISQGIPATLVVARQPAKTTVKEALKKRNFLIVERQTETVVGTTLFNALRAIIGDDLVKRTTLQELTAEQVPTKCTIFSLCELVRPLLSTISDEDMLRVKIMTDKAAILVWVTGGNILEGKSPDFALVSGLARAVGIEQPSLRFFTYDLDDAEKNVTVTAKHLISVLDQPSGSKEDMEFAQRDSVVHVSRFTPDDEVNASFRNKQGLEPSITPLSDAGDIRLAIERPSQFDTIFFKEQEAPLVIPNDHVRIKVASVGVNAKDYYVLAGRVDTPDSTCQLECAGTVVEVGSGVTEYAVGDRIVAMAPTHFQTYQTLPSWACYKLRDTESFDVCATLPLVYSTAIYALHDRARVQAGETVLIHSGAGGVGIAAIQLALIAGAEVFTTVSTDEKKQYLVDKFGIKPSHIFSSRDVSFLEGILDATSGRGVDIILNSLTGDQLHATWRCAAEFGRFVEIGKMDLSNAGRLEMDQFLKNTTFSAFDLGNLYLTDNKDYHAIWKNLLAQVMSLYRGGTIKPVEPLRVFDISETPQAYRHFASRSRIGKVAINLETPGAEVLVQRRKHAARFDGAKSYVLVGCLGGLGRTLSRWMVARGARKFAFLGRSGLQKAAARNLVRDLEALGAECAVVTGDVCVAADVQAVVAVAAGMGSIGGVVQAAMGLNEAIFTDMSNHYWHTGIDPKVHGTWNLYHALRADATGQYQSSELDFFLMTSSVSGSVGTATEANYCAGNHFLDLFARYLRSQGLPGVSVGLGMISEVGYLHDNPEIEALLLRKGIQPIDADEMVQILDLALYNCAAAKLGIHHAHDDLAAAHLLTGMEASGMKELRKKGFAGNHPALEDPRAGLLASALGGDDDGNHVAGQDGSLPAEVVKAMETEEQTLEEAVLDHVRRRFANLILMKYDAVDVKKPLAEYGMDSMIGAEFRTWLYQSLKAEVLLSVLLGRTCTLETLRDVAMAGLEKD
ncbi:Type I Iterative PKS [Cytospora paraplurivora]|uniref:Type I Iterative PKS n=1 Tax=Cytospora paraplurivora TaxID=2898453 RepID=A0AAN9YJV3_9PEZI